MVFQLQNVRVELRIVIMKLRKLIFFAVTALMLSSLQCLYAHDAAFPLPSNKINEYPFNMVGKVSSGDIFSGSGTAISQKVVLAAAHSFFDEEILDWEPGPFKWNRQHSPSNRLFEMSSRSYRYFSDYAEATRRFLPDDESHSWEQFNLDVICLIFYNDVANGGYAGLGRNRITDYSDKMIVGYPQLNYGYYDSRRHTMHSTSLNGSRAKYTLVNYSDRLGNKRRAYWTEDLSTGPGNSGGPVFGRVNFSTGTDWGVVGIAVAGFTGESSTAVGIDQAVYDLIKEAESASGGSTPRDDHGDTRGTATKVELNRSVSGNLETAGDIDYFQFSLRKKGTVTISTTGGTDTLGTLRNSLGNYIETNDDSGQRENFSIKRSLTPGTFYISVSHALSQGIGTYSLRVNFVEKVTYPDLAVDSVRVNKTSVKSGDTVQVTLRRSNKGDKNSATFNHGIYLSRDRTITTSDRSLANLRATSMIAGASSTFSQEVTIPKNTTPGTYYIGYIVDTNKRVRETSEANNTGYTAITVTRPVLDLVLAGSGDIVGQDIRHPSGNVFDQVLLTSQHIKLKARPGRITRASFMDHNLDIVQVEFSGAGTFTINLDPATFVSARFPPLYNQQVKYVTGTASIIIEGADASTFFSVFTVGRINAVNQALFPLGQRYDAQADIKLVEVINSVGFGGMQLANTVFSGRTGKVGIDARDVPIAVRLTVSDIDASGTAMPYLLFGKGSFTVPASNSGLRITGGDLYQSNRAKIVAISEADEAIFQANIRSDGTELRARTMQGSFDYIDRVVTSFIPKSFNDIGYRYRYEFDPEFYDVYLDGSLTSGNYSHYVTIFIEESDSVLLLTGYGWYNSRIDSEDHNKIYITFTATRVELYLDDLDLFSGSFEEYVEFLYQLSEISGEPFSSIPKSGIVEMNFKTFTTGTLIAYIDKGEFISSGTFEEIDYE